MLITTLMFIQHVINDALGAWHHLYLLLSPKPHGPQLFCSSSEGQHFVSTKCCFYRQSASRQREIPCRFWINAAVDVQIAWSLPLTTGWFIWNQFLSWLWTMWKVEKYSILEYIFLYQYSVLCLAALLHWGAGTVTPGYTFVHSFNSGNNTDV